MLRSTTAATINEVNIYMPCNMQLTEYSVKNRTKRQSIGMKLALDK